MHGDRHYDWPDQEPPDKDKRKRREYPGHGQARLEQIDGKEGPAPAQDHGVNAVMQVEEVDRPVAEESHTAASIQSACSRRSSNGLRAGARSFLASRLPSALKNLRRWLIAMANTGRIRTCDPQIRNLSTRHHAPVAELSPRGPVISRRDLESGIVKVQTTLVAGPGFDPTLR